MAPKGKNLQMILGALRGASLRRKPDPFARVRRGRVLPSCADEGLTMGRSQRRLWQGVGV
ncbi:hypothetical protein GCM10010990_30480 [Croceicoccus mobilis]|uniref:Uncharacterized protein n=1 Tax=Croceicoccus mobilis TaxID=1703339 RepID=A0A916Z6N0_9SPHN|nr:hypothetical protein GCM10010990_30480 [Croceicoccus mobilis]